MLNIVIVSDLCDCLVTEDTLHPVSRLRSTYSLVVQCSEIIIKLRLYRVRADS